jgi:hypothetical protein
MPKIYALKPHVRNNVIRHPLFPHARFNDAGEADWPLDQFTLHRIRDEDISLTPPEAYPF